MGCKAREFDGLVRLEGWGRGRVGFQLLLQVENLEIRGTFLQAAKGGKIRRGGRVGKKIVFPVFPKK